jgi:hypothetical protein
MVNINYSEPLRGLNHLALVVGNNLVEFIYRRDDCKSRDNSIFIESMSIYGSDEGTSLTCQPCPLVLINNIGIC